MLEASQRDSRCFPHRVQVELKPKDILRLYAKTLYYSVGQLFCIILGIGAVVTHLRKVMTNVQAAQNTSLITLAISVVWHFNLFWQHFIYTGMGAYFEFMRIPACGFFL
jgi:hypothetical protein